MAASRGPSEEMNRRTFLKAGAGIAVFGGMFLVVGCGGDEGDDDDAASPVAGAALRTALARGAANSAAPTATLPPRATTGPLFDRLGGRPAIQRAIDQFLPIVAFDNRINTFFATADANRLSVLLVEFLVNVTGGPDPYTGRTMKATHAAMKIQKVHFDALMEDLLKAIDGQQMPAKERAELVALLNPMATDIVTA